MPVWGILPVLLLTVIAAICFRPGEAEAGQYTVWSCRGPDDLPISSEAWRFRASEALPGDVTFADACLTGGAMNISVSPVAPTLTRRPRGYAHFDIPAGTKIVAYELHRYLRVATPPTVGTYAAGVREVSGVSESNTGCASGVVIIVAQCVSLGSPTDPDAAANKVERGSLDLDGLELWAACLSAGCTAGFLSADAEFKLYRSAVVLEDPIAPSPPQLSGTLTGPEPLSGNGILVVESHDVGSGIAAIELAIDGGPPQVAAPAGPSGRCREPYYVSRPCPTEAARVFTVDTTTLSPGAHSASGRVIDAAGNVTAFGPLVFKVAPTPPPGGPRPMPPAGRGPGTDDPPRNGSPAVRSARLKLARRTLDLAPGRVVRLRGKLTTAKGEPISGAKLAVEQSDLITGRSLRMKPVVTSARGTFAIAVRGQGARKVTVSFAPTVGGSPTATATARVRSRPQLRLTRHPVRIGRNGTVEFKGRFRGGGRAAQGAVVEIQAIVSGSWRTVATVTTSPNGAFRWRYRFRYVDRDAIFSFRAVLRHTPGWPWPTLHSRRVAVVIHG